MRHRVYGKKLGRNKNERRALFKSLVQELFLHGNLTTSEAKAKAIKGLADKIINLAKSKNSQRLLQAYFSNKLLQERLIKEIAPKLGNRISGYTSMIRMGAREGDSTTVVKMSIIGAEELKPLEQVTSNKIPASQAKRGEQVISKKTDKIKKPVVRKVATVKKVTAKKTTIRKTSK
ncbi:50S ribosomal protein L17 [Candidatus Daviesbacteria bacterium]|nr:50S ribosomal protein L17 [Candidatus Daviesbacteria bacterium]